MEKKKFITDEERERCRRVAAAYLELENEDIVVLDVGRYGFVKLRHYDPTCGFDEVTTFTDSRTMFENLWQEWLCRWIISTARDTPLIKLDYDEIYKYLTKEKQSELREKKLYFAERTGIQGVLLEKEN